jgi:hypothetical protein
MGMRDASFYALKGTAILLALLFEVLSRQLLRGATVWSSDRSGAGGADALL